MSDSSDTEEDSPPPLPSTPYPKKLPDSAADPRLELLMSSMTSENMIHNGGNGCVIKPAVRCDNNLHKSEYYRDRISKVVKEDEANNELDSFHHIKTADPNSQFTIETPETCLPHDSVIPILKQCTQIGLDTYNNSNDVFVEPDIYGAEKKEEEAEKRKKGEDSRFCKCVMRE